jgi:hypothetical protein
MLLHGGETVRADGHGVNPAPHKKLGWRVILILD